MNVIELSADGLKREFKVVIPAQDIAAQIDSRLLELSRTLKLPGFRPGKVPVAVIKQRYAAGVRQEALEKLVSDSAEQVIRDRGLRHALQPSVSLGDLTQGADLEYTLTVEVMPDIEPCDFAGLAFERPTVEVTEDEVQRVVDRLADDARPTEPVAEERPTATGDVVVLDFTASHDGQPVAGMEVKDASLTLGSGTAVPGFEDNLVGARVGEQRRFPVTMPENHPSAELAGKELMFEVTVKQLLERKPVALDDELAKQRFGFDSLEELRRAVRTQSTRQYAQRARVILKRRLLDRLAELHDFPVPPGLVEAEFQAIWERVAAEMKQGGSAEAEMNRPEEELQAEYRTIAERRVRLGLLLAEVGRRNNITVGRDELNRAVLAEARRYPGQELAVMDFFKKNPQAAERFRAPLFEEKVVDFILELAQVSERAVDADELARLEQEAERTAA